jgi:hypothetical protein
MQAIRVGEAAWGVQFHVEVGAETVAEWAGIPEYRAELERIGGGDPSWLQDAVTAQLGAMRETARHLVAGLVDAMARTPTGTPR